MKKKILINLMTNNISQEEFTSISKPFGNSFEIFNFQFSISDIFPDIFGAVIKELKIDCKKSWIIFQTNIPDLAHFSMKFYSEHIDAIIVYPKSTDYLYKNNKDFSYIKNIFKLNCKDIRLQKIYTYLESDFDLNYLRFIDMYKLYNEVEFMEKFEFVLTEKMTQKIIFNLDSMQLVSDLENYKNVKIINNEIKRKVSKSKYDYLTSADGFFLATKYLANKVKKVQDTGIYLEGLIEGLEKANSDGETLNELYWYLEHYMATYWNSIEINEFGTMNMLCFIFKDKEAYKRQYRFLEDRIESLDPYQAHALITNVFFYETKLNFELFNMLYIKRMNVRERIIEMIKPNFELPKEVKKNKKNIAIMAGQLLSLRHSPTKWALDYANNLKKYNPDFNIKIFVDDWGNYSPNELVWKGAFYSDPSGLLKAVHDTYKHPEVSIYYSDASLTREERLKQDIRAITEFEPTIIFKVGSRYSLSVDLLYEHFPVVSHTIFSAEDSKYVDVFTGGYPKKIMEEIYLTQNLSEISYISHKVGLEFPEAKVNLNREDYNIDENDFVLITVGNRLHAEVSVEFVLQVKKALEAEPNIKWLIVGIDKLYYVEEHCNTLIADGRIKYVKYETNLYDLYRLCHVYVNPVRKTGGISATWAMSLGLPIVTTDVESDVGGFSGQEKNCIALEEFSQEILKLYSNQEYYQKKSTQMRETIYTNHSFENTTKEILNIFEQAQANFKLRSSKK